MASDPFTYLDIFLGHFPSEGGMYSGSEPDPVRVGACSTPRSPRAALAALLDSAFIDASGMALSALAEVGLFLMIISLPSGADRMSRETT